MYRLHLKHSFKCRLVAAILLLISSGETTHAQSLNVVLNPIPQAYTNTCQSYSLGFALARSGAPGFKLESLADVRALEARVRSGINAEVRSGETAYHHTVWARAVQRLTSNKYVLNRTEYPSLDLLINDVSKKTGISNATALGPVISIAASKVPVMTSFRRIGASSYNTGHLVTLFGVERGTGSVSTIPRLLILNSAVKTAELTPAAYAPLCNSSELPGDLRYTGSLSLEGDYELSRFNGQYVLFWVSRR